MLRVFHDRYGKCSVYHRYVVENSCMYVPVVIHHFPTTLYLYAVGSFSQELIRSIADTRRIYLYIVKSYKVSVGAVMILVRVFMSSMDCGYMFLKISLIHSPIYTMGFVQISHVLPCKKHTNVCGVANFASHSSFPSNPISSSSSFVGINVDIESNSKMIGSK